MTYKGIVVALLDDKRTLIVKPHLPVSKELKLYNLRIPLTGAKRINLLWQLKIGTIIEFTGVCKSTRYQLFFPAPELQKQSLPNVVRIDNSAVYTKTF